MQTTQSNRPPHIRVGRLVKLLLFGLVVPLTAVFLLDYFGGTTPWATIAAIIICIPLTTVLVSRAALQEMDMVIQIVAPINQSAPGADFNLHTSQRGNEHGI